MKNHNGVDQVCFVICPIGPPNSKVRSRANTLLEKVVEPVVKQLGFRVLRADDPSVDGDLNEAIAKHVREDPLVIADLTDVNPNVLYELGRRHAFGGRVVHVAEPAGIANLPFDVRHYKVHTYDLKSADRMEKSRKDLELAIRATTEARFPLSVEEAQKLSGATVLVGRVTGKRSHYDLATRFASRRCRRIFLMQRSSTLILGPERGWGEESDFHKVLLRQIRNGAALFHVVTPDGIERHLERKSSVFPDVNRTVRGLRQLGGRVGIASSHGPLWYFKRAPTAAEDQDVKSDRQARVLLAELYDGSYEGAIVFDLGGKQSAFHLSGPEMRTYLEECINFYHECDHLLWSDLRSALGEHVDAKPPEFKMPTPRQTKQSDSRSARSRTRATLAGP